MDFNAYTWAGRNRTCRPDVHRFAPELWEGVFMSDHEDRHSGGPIPLMQQLMDSPFLLLFLGVVLPTLIYIIWGVMEIVAIPVAP